MKASTKLEDFDFAGFQEKAIKHLKSGRSHGGQGGVSAPSIKVLLKAVLERALETHLNAKVRNDDKVVQKTAYTMIGKTQKGYKDALDFYISESARANFWLHVLSDLSNRGVKDILIACVDGLKGFPDVITTIFQKLRYNFA